MLVCHCTLVGTQACKTCSRYIDYFGEVEEKSDNVGWVCPKCGTVYSPNVGQCWVCSKKDITCNLTIEYGKSN